MVNGSVIKGLGVPLGLEGAAVSSDRALGLRCELLGGLLVVFTNGLREIFGQSIHPMLAAMNLEQNDRVMLAVPLIDLVALCDVVQRDQMLELRAGGSCRWSSSTAGGIEHEIQEVVQRLSEYDLFPTAERSHAVGEERQLVSEVLDRFAILRNLSKNNVADGPMARQEIR
jgi:hypothetical protein